MKPLSEKIPIPLVSAAKGPTRSATHNASPLVEGPRKSSGIRFVRSRMLYARAALNAKGGVRFGMRHIRKAHDKIGKRSLLRYHRRLE